MCCSSTGYSFITQSAESGRPGDGDMNGFQSASHHNPFVYLRDVFLSPIAVVVDMTIVNFYDCKLRL